MPNFFLAKRKKKQPAKISSNLKLYKQNTSYTPKQSVAKNKKIKGI